MILKSQSHPFRLCNNGGNSEEHMLNSFDSTLVMSLRYTVIVKLEALVESTGDCVYMEDLPTKTTNKSSAIN